MTIKAGDRVRYIGHNHSCTDPHCAPACPWFWIIPFGHTGIVCVTGPDSVRIRWDGDQPGMELFSTVSGHLEPV